MAHALQKRLVDGRADGEIGDQLLLLEHPAVLTLGRHSDPAHILATPDDLARARHRASLRVERGGEVTYHGPGQLVAYPIIALAERGLLLRPLVRALEAALVDDVRRLRRRGRPDATATPAAGAIPTARRRARSARSACASSAASRYHGIALNVSVDLADFELIDPCGMPGVESRPRSPPSGPAAARPAAADHRVGRAGGSRLRPGVRRRASARA